jgi:hypothetical protein
MLIVFIYLSLGENIQLKLRNSAHPKTGKTKLKLSDRSGKYIFSYMSCKLSGTVACTYVCIWVSEII